MRFSTTVAAASLALTATLIASPVDAAPILGTAGSGLQNAGIPTENAGRYWDGNSWDSDSSQDGPLGANPCNVGSLAGGTPCGLNAAAVGVAARAGLTGTNFTLAESGTRLRGVGQRRRLGRPELRVRRHGRRPLRLPDARRVHRRLGRQRDRLVRAGQPAEPPHHLRRGRRGGRDGAGVHPDQLRLLLPEHLGQRRGLLHAVAVQHARATSSSSPPSSAGSTPSSASRTSSRTC